VTKVAPIRAETDKDEVYVGELRASLIEGSAKLSTSSGDTCHGTFDQFSAGQPTVMMYISCDDGRHGKMISHPDPPVGSGTGTGTGTLNDGTKVTFAWGNKRISEMDQ